MKANRKAGDPFSVVLRRMNRRQKYDEFEIPAKGGLYSVFCILLLLSGCTESQKQANVAPQTGSAARLSSLSEHGATADQEQMAKRFQEPTFRGRTALESAIELSEKYAKISEESVALRENSRKLVDENNRLKEQVSKLEADLKNAQKELTEANNLLMEMRIELNNWKTDVLGFRNEIRQAEIAQLEALLKILKIISGEITVESSPAEKNEASTEAPRGGSSEASQSAGHLSVERTENTLVQGEPNE